MKRRVGGPLSVPHFWPVLPEVGIFAETAKIPAYTRTTSAAATTRFLPSRFA